MAKIRVMVVDDHPTFREGLASLLREEPDLEVVGTLEDGIQALETASDLQPEIALLDIMMPRLNGLEAAKRIRDISPDTSILMLSAFAYPSYIMASITAGASGYLTKDTSLDKIIGAIRMIHSGHSVFDLQAVDKLMTHAVSIYPNEGVPLQPPELQVLRLLVQGKASKDISGQLNISLRTVQTHLVHIFQKLGVNSRTEAVLKALKEGWVNLEEVNLASN